MASRAEEKERRRQERLEKEQVEQKAAARTRRLQLAGGALLGVAAVVAIVLVVSGGGSNSSSAGGPAPSDASGTGVKLPVPKETDLTKAAAAAKCVVKSFPLYGRDHTTATVHYKTNPPTSGDHNPDPAEDGYYPNGAPPPERYVHSLEHGRIEMQWKPGTPKKVVDTLLALFNEPLKGKSGYHELLFQNNTGMPFQVAVAAWQHYLGCPSWNENVIDAIRAFRVQYVDKGPEFIP